MTAGIDFGLAITEMRRGRDYAEAVQLLAEYDPQPPFTAGTPEKACATKTDMMTAMFAGFRDQIRELAIVKN